MYVINDAKTGDPMLDWLTELGRRLALLGEQRYREMLEEEAKAAELGAIYIRGLGCIRTLLAEISRDPFVLEKMRGLWPDSLIQAAYSAMRNHPFPPYVSLRVRQLAGVVDESGQPVPGFEVLSNGSIIEAKKAPGA